jgi:hypothetical protein
MTGIERGGLHQGAGTELVIVLPKRSRALGLTGKN